MRTKFFVRLDDACPTMDGHKWSVIENVLDKYEIRPMVGIVPHCEDPKLQIVNEDNSFWRKVNSWKQKGWTIAMHGYNHVYSSNNAGINPIWHKSEFAGLSLYEQKEKIRNGIAIFEEQGIKPRHFFAPSHTFDINTLEALKSESDIRIICDTWALHPYRLNDFMIIPQQVGHFTNPLLSGHWTFCFHPNVMDDKQMFLFEQFIRMNSVKFSSFDEISMDDFGKKSIVSKFLSFLYFTYRKLRG